MVDINHKTTNLRINSSRLWDSLMEMAKIGPGIAGGNNRQALTDEDAQGRALFHKWCDEAGLTMVLTKWERCSPDEKGRDQTFCLSMWVVI